MASFSFKTLPKTEDARQCSKREQGYVNDCEIENSFKDEVVTDEIEMYSACRFLASTEPTCDTHVCNVKPNSDRLEIGKSKDTGDSNESFCFKETPIGKTSSELLNTHKMNDSHLKDSEAKLKGIANLSCQSKNERSENLTIQRAHTSPKLKYTKDSKRKNKGHRRTLSFDDNIENQTETLKSHSPKTTKRNAIPYNTEISNKHSSDLVVVVDNSNIFIGAQECATIVNLHERKRNIRVKIQQLVKVFQKGRVVSRAFVQGSSPPTTEQVWEVYRYVIHWFSFTVINHHYF